MCINIAELLQRLDLLALFANNTSVMTMTLSEFHNRGIGSDATNPKTVIITDDSTGIFVYDASDTFSPDDNFSVLVDKNGRRYKRLFDFTKYYERVKVNTKAQADEQATGRQCKIIIVAVDETDNGVVNRYYYDGDNQPLGEPLF